MGTVRTCPTSIWLPEERVWTQRVAKETMRKGVTLDELEIYGTPLNEVIKTGFKPAKSSDINFGLPTPLKNILKNSMTAQPKIMQTCQRCGHCVTHCPPQAMSIDQRGVHIDYDQCIRCFCCQELCPHNAINTRQGLFLKLAEFIQGHK